MITYSIGEDGIFYVKFAGPTSYAEIKDYLLKFKEITGLPEKIRLLYDFTEGIIDLAEDDLVNIAQLADKATVRYTTVRTAFLVNKPDTTAFTYMFSQFRKSNRAVRRIFSTRHAAMNWLKSNA